MTTAISELTGEPVDTSSEAWRAECEARHVLSLPSREHRNRLLYGYTDYTGKKHRGIADIRGMAAADQLKALAERLYYARKDREAKAAEATLARVFQDDLTTFDGSAANGCLEL